jgi:hypothetical protein
MSTDSQGRPLSDDGQWAWNGTEWVPAAGGPPEPEAIGAAPAEDVGATMIVQSPFAGGVPGAAPQANVPGYGGAQPGPAQPPGYAQPQGYGQAPGYGQSPGYASGAPVSYGTPGAAAAPGSYGVPPQQPKSRKPLILVVIGVLLIAAVVVVLVVTLGGSSKKSVSGAYTCISTSRAGTGIITFKSGGTYTLNQGGTGGNFSRSGSHVTFASGDLKTLSGTLSNGDNTLTLTFRGLPLTCKK